MTIKICYEESCPYCHEEIDFEMKEGENEGEFECNCGAEIVFKSESQIEMTVTRPK